MITFLGIASASGSIADPVTDVPVPLFQVITGLGFRLVIEAAPGPSSLPVGQSVFNSAPDNPFVRPDLQIEASRSLGDGNLAVCGEGGVPAVAPPHYGDEQAIANALNDLSCRFEVAGNPALACTVDAVRRAELRRRPLAGAVLPARVVARSLSRRAHDRHGARARHRGESGPDRADGPARWRRTARHRHPAPPRRRSASRTPTDTATPGPSPTATDTVPTPTVTATARTSRPGPPTRTRPSRRRTVTDPHATPYADADRDADGDRHAHALRHASTPTRTARAPPRRRRRRPTRARRPDSAHPTRTGSMAATRTATITRTRHPYPHADPEPARSPAPARPPGPARRRGRARSPARRPAPERRRARRRSR